MEQSYGYFQDKYLLIGPEVRQNPEFGANTEPVPETLLLTKSDAKTPEFDAN